MTATDGRKSPVATATFTHGHERPVPYRLEAALARTPDGGTEVTLFPADAPRWQLMTNWITAEQGIVLPLEECR